MKVYGKSVFASGVVIVLFISTSLFAQQNEIADTTSIPKEKKKQKEEVRPRRGFLAFSAGPAYPIGDFSKSDFEIEKSGFAKNGFQFSLVDFGFKFVPNFGLSASFKGTNIPVDVKAIANYYAKTYGGEFRVESTRWNFGGIFVGPFLSFPSRYADLDFRLRPGLIVAFSPDIEIRRGQEYANQTSAAGASIAITAGLGGRIHINRWLSVMISADYFRARPVFNVESNNNGYGDSDSFYQEISLYSFSGGLALRLF